MGIRHHEELVCWQPAFQLHQEIVAITARPSVSKDRRFCDQVRDASSSAMENMSEGFWRFKPRDFAQFLRVACGSLGETETHLRVAFARRYIDEAEFNRMFQLTERAIKVTTGLLKSLRHANEPDWRLPAPKP